MQPPRPFQGAPYDKNMFTFLPAVANVESPKKRNLLASDRDITMPASTMGYGSSGNLYPKENAVDLGDRELPNCIQASLPGESSTSRNYSNDFVAPCQPSESQGYSSFVGEGQSFRYKDSSLLFQPSVRPAHNLSNWNPLVTEEIDQHGTDVSKAQVGGEEKGFDFPKCQTYGQQNPSLMKIEGSDPNAQTLEEPQNLQQYVSKSGTYVVDLDGKGCHEHSFKIETSSNTKGLGDSSIFANMLGNNVGTLSLHSLHEANNVIQQALRIVRASSGSGLTVNQDGISQACEGDPMKMNSTPNSLTQDLVRSLIETTSAPGGEAGLNVDKPVTSVEKSSIDVDDGPKIEEGDSALAEKLWDGTLQLSFSVSVSTIAFFKSGERLQDFSWPGSVEVKGKVKLEAFEKYVQDLPRSRTRGLMVMSLCAKDDSSGAGLKRMKEIAKRYRDGNRVGLAQSGSGVDMYICPHSDTIITILARHGFFKGNIAVAEKSDPLLGCVVWRKNSSAPATKTTVIDDPESGPSLSAPSSSDAKKIPSENPEKTQTEAEIGKNSSGNKSPEVCLAPPLDQSEQLMIPESMIKSVSDNNKQVSGSNGNVETNKPNVSLLPVLNQSAELCDDEDLPEYDFGAANLQICKSKAAVTAAISPTPEMAQSSDSQDHRSTAAQMRADNSTVSGILSNLQLQGLQQLIQKQSEVQNRISQAQQEQQTAVSLTTEMVQYRDSQAHQATTAQMRADSSTLSGILSDFQLQGLQKLIQNHSDAQNRSTQAWQEQQRGDCTFSSRSSVQGTLQNLGNQPEPMIPSQPMEGKRPLDECTATLKPNNLFDDDDMPEWQPPDFKKMRPEGNVMAGPPFALSNSIRPGPSFTDLATGRQLPPPPPRPPLPRPPAFTPVQPHDRKFPTEHQLPLPPPPLPPLPPPSSQGQFFDNNYPPVPHLPKPPAHAFNLENPDAKTSMHNSSLAQSTPVQFQGNHYSPAGHLPPPPSLPPPPPLPPLVRAPFSDNGHSTAHHFPKPSANNFNHNGAAAPPTHERFSNQHFPPLPPLPPPVPDNTFANNFTYNDNTSTSPLARQDKHVRDDSGHRAPPFPPGFTPNPGFRPKYQQHGRDNHTHPSAWRNSRP